MSMSSSSFRGTPAGARPLTKVPSFSILEDDDSEVFLSNNNSKNGGDSSLASRNRTHSDSFVKGKMDSGPRRGLALSDSSNNLSTRSTSYSALSSSNKADDFKFKKPLGRPKQLAMARALSSGQSRGQSAPATSSPTGKNIKRIGRKNANPNNENSYPYSVVDLWKMEFYLNEREMQDNNELCKPMWADESSVAEDENTVNPIELVDDFTLDENANDSFVSTKCISPDADEDDSAVVELELPFIEKLPTASPWDFDEFLSMDPGHTFSRDDPPFEEPPALKFSLDNREILIGCSDDCTCSRCLDEMNVEEASFLTSPDAELSEDCESPDESMSR